MASAPRVSGWIREKCLRCRMKIKLYKMKRWLTVVFQGSGNRSFTKFHNRSRTQNELVLVITFPLSVVTVCVGTPT